MVDSQRVKSAARIDQDLSYAKLERAVLGVDVNGLTFADFAFEDLDAKRIENFFLDGAP